MRRIHHSRVTRKWLLALLVGFVSAAGWFIYRESAKSSVLAELPAVPDLWGEGARLAEEILRLDAEVRSDPLSVPKISRLAMTYHASEMSGQAMACYLIAARLSPHDYRWLYYRAVLLEKKGEYSQAISLLQKVTGSNPDYVHAWARLGGLLFRETQIESAERALREALSLDPLHPHASLVRARVAAWQGDWQSVIATLSPTLKKHPLLAPAWRLQARAHIQLGRPPPEWEEAPEAPVPAEEIIDEPLMDDIYDLSALALIQGNPERGQTVMTERCTRCHTVDRINVSDKTPQEWLRTVRRMQRLAEPGWLDDMAAAHVLAHLSSPRN